LRVLYFSRGYTTHDYRFLQAISQAGHKTSYLRLENGGLASEERPLPAGVKAVRWQGVPGKAKGPEDWLRLLGPLEEVIKSANPDIVQAGPIQSCGLMLSMLEFHPLLIMSWGSDILVDADRDPFWRWMTEHALANSDRLLCDSRTVANRATEISGFPHKRVIRIPWGVDLDQFSPGPDTEDIRGRLGWDDCFVLLATRAWEPIHGVDDLVDAFLLARERCPRLRLLLVGTGSMSHRIRAAISAHGLARVIHCPGQVSQLHLPQYYRAADAYVSCSHSDGTSVSLLEAMASGLPVVVTDIAGNREWVRPGRNGWVAPPNNRRLIAYALLRAARSSQRLLRQMGVSNRRIAERRADWQANVEKLMRAYTEMRLRRVGC